MVQTRQKLTVPSWNYVFVSPFSNGKYSELADITSQAVFYVQKFSGKTPWRPMMLPPEGYRRHLSEFYWEIPLHFRVAARKKKSLQVVSILQFAGDFESAEKLLKKYKKKSQIEFLYLAMVQGLVVLGVRFNPREILKKFLGVDVEGLNKSEKIFYLQLGQKLMSFYVNYQVDSDNFSVVHQKTNQALGYLSDLEKSYAQAVNLRYEAVNFFNIGEVEKSKKLLKRAISKLTSLKSKDPYFSFLIKEAQRRIYMRLYMVTKPGKEKKNILNTLKLLDPHCHEVNLILLNSQDTALSEKIRVFHFYNYNAATFDLNFGHHLVRNKEGHLAEVFYLKFLQEASRLGVKNIVDFKALFKNSETNGAIYANQYLTSGYTKKSFAEVVYAPFFGGKAPKEMLIPNYFHNPLLAQKAFLKNKSSIYESLYLQRNVSFGFRYELAHFAAGNRYHSLLETNIISIPQGLKKPPASRGRWAAYLRYLISLGYQIRVFELLHEMPFKKAAKMVSQDNIELLSVAGFVYERLRPEKKNKTDYGALDIDLKILSLPENKAIERLQLVSIIRILIHYFKDTKTARENKKSIENLIEKGEGILFAMAKNKRITSFELSILKSRFYRAKAFYFEMNKDVKNLLKSMKVCLSEANKAINLAKKNTKRDETKIILARDNLMGYLESMARTHLALGHSVKALRLMRQLTKVDPMESKAWIQYGEMLYRRRSFKAAKFAFINALSLGPPLYSKAWFLLGHTYLKLQKESLAYLCWVESLRAAPYSLELVHQVNALGEKMNDIAVVEWTKSLIKILR